ncbi:radical SAM/SPASM domain-containing protein [Thalassospira sp.]|uniref:radical SAM/SPASM domain-containing protein n=1 Tax=Thalassospira sp. TaxID=1912094 RepID=UPI001B11FB56|nr:radical SAM/SPASM domain-containing protein [Thalassospira sp.]MBO6805957.1 radical SAM protein [Thalassospira sp.]
MSNAAENRNYVIEGVYDTEAARQEAGVRNMHLNKAYIYAVEDAGGDPDGAILRSFQEKYLWYRRGWRQLPADAVDRKLCGASFREAEYPPLCVDIETAAVCDLACSFCFRQWVATPDKIIKMDLYKALIDQCKELGVPSIKLNWRGEPLLHPQLPEMIDYAKRAGILEVIINSNATTLNESKARELIDSGLDLLIYSFDGGTKETYEKMRPGRFKANTFEEVYGNIRNFSDIRSDMGAILPRTKIQMILTKETFEEKDTFFANFSDCVDDVTVKPYTERGGKISELDESTSKILAEELDRLKLPHDVPFWRDLNGNMYVSTGRIPCEQPFQRVLVTYDGRVSMCCYDWGSQYPVGYVSEQAIESGEKEYEKIMNKIQAGAKGFEDMTGARLPDVLNQPAKEVRTLRDIWYGKEIDHVRKMHISGCGEKVAACKHCTFKETYAWAKIGESE